MEGEKTDSRTMSQNERVLAYLESGKTLTSNEALFELGVARLASRVSHLRKEGYPINHKRETVTDRFGKKTSVNRYYLEKEEGK